MFVIPSYCILYGDPYLQVSRGDWEGQKAVLKLHDISEDMRLKDDMARQLSAMNHLLDNDVGLCSPGFFIMTQLLLAPNARPEMICKKHRKHN